MDTVVQALARGDTIEAIKIYRAANSVDLKASKEAVEQIARDLQPGTVGLGGPGTLGARPNRVFVLAISILVAICCLGLLLVNISR